jgi:GAF domain-containing protein
MTGLPDILFGELLFSAAFWAALLVVAAATLLTPALASPTQVAVIAVCLLTLLAYHQTAQRRMPGAAGRVVLTAVDAVAVVSIFALTLPVGPATHSLLFFAAANLAARFRRPMALLGGLVLALPFALISGGGVPELGVEGFTVVALMGSVQFILAMADRAREAADVNAGLLSVASSLARAHDEGTVYEDLIRLVPPVSPQSTWIAWRWDADLQAYRPVRWYGLPTGLQPLAYWTLPNGPTQLQAVELEGSVPFNPGTGDTLIQPLHAGGILLGMISMSGSRASWTPGQKAVLRGIAEEAGVALGRAHLLAEERTRTVELEVINAIARDITLSRSPVESLQAVVPQLSRVVVFDSLHLSVFTPTALALIAGPGDPLSRYLPEEMPPDRTRAQEVCTRGCSINEAVSDARWRPEDEWWSAAGLTSVLAVPLAIPGQTMGALHLGRRETVAFTVRERHVTEAVAGLLAAELARTPMVVGARAPELTIAEAAS